MSVQPEAAIDEVLGIYQTFATIKNIPVFYLTDDSTAPNTQIVWSRVSLFHIDSNKLTIGDAFGKALYERVARFMVTVAFPADKALNGVYPLLAEINNLFEGKRSTSGIRFYHTRIDELGKIEGWFKANVITTFKYEEYK